MRNNWPRVGLGEVLSRSAETINLLPDAKLWGKGVILRGVLTGAQIAAPRQMVARQNQFILSRIDARNGALGIVPAELDGAVVSNDFPLFNLVADRMLPAYLGRICKAAAFVEECRRASEGTTNRVRLQEEKFLAREILLPPLEEQRRIVARIEEFEAKIGEARGLRRQAMEEAEQIMATEERRIWNEEALRDAKPLNSLALFLARGRQSEQGDSDHFLIKTQHVQQGRYVSTSMRLATHIAAKVRPEALVRDGDILIACSAAGCLGRVARYRGDGRSASTDTHVAIARANPNVVDPDYLYAYLRGSQGQHQLRSRERGDWQREKIGFRLTELNLNDLRAVPVPVPSTSEQRRIAAYLDDLQERTNALKALQAETSVEIDALMPSILDKAFRGEM
jgi:type I restriction enzyme S subunit